MAICTKAEVFKLLQIKPDMETQHGDQVDALILQCTAEVEQMLGRKLDIQMLDDIVLFPGQNCDIYYNELILKGFLRDLLIIEDIFEDKVQLIEKFGPDVLDEDGFYFNRSLGIIFKNFGNWDTRRGALVLSGYFGIAQSWLDISDPSEYAPPLDLKQAVIEMVAAKTGLWKINTMTDAGNITTIRTAPSKETLASIEKYKMRYV